MRRNADRRRREERRALRGSSLEVAKMAERRDGAAGALLEELRALVDASTEASQRMWGGDRNWPAGHRVGDRWIGGALNLGRVLWLGDVASRPALAKGGVGHASATEYLGMLDEEPGVGAFGVAFGGEGRFIPGVRAGAFALAEDEGWLTIGVRANRRGTWAINYEDTWPELPGYVFEWGGPGPDRVHIRKDVFDRLLALRRAGVLKVEPDASGELEAAVDARLAEANVEPLLCGAPLALPRVMRTMFFAIDPLSFDINLGSYANRLVRPAFTSISLLDEKHRGKTFPVAVAASVWDEESATLAFDVTKVDVEVPGRVGAPTPSAEWLAWPELHEIQTTMHWEPEKAAAVLREWSADPRRIRARRDVVTWLRRRWHEGVAGPFEEGGEEP